MNESLPDLLRRAAACAREKRRVVACLVVGARGSTPQSAGAMMLVDEDAGTWGTIGGGCVEAEVRRRAIALLHDRGSGLMCFKLDHDYGWDDGLICGGTLELAVAPLPDSDMLDAVISDIANRRETSLAFRIRTDDGPAEYRLHLPPRDRLLVAGAGHVGQAVARLAMPLEFDVAIYDDRADLLERMAPPGVTTVAGDIADQLAAAAIDDRTYCLVVTRGHRHDEQALHAVVGRGAAYVGMIGSRRKVKLIFDDLRARGIDDAALADVHAPVGLDIGAVTVEEIALAIVAQLVEHRRSRTRIVVSGPHAIIASGSGAES
jgi:xanthine dehydrogenase accessory factor